MRYIVMAEFAYMSCLARLMLARTSGPVVIQSSHLSPSRRSSQASSKLLRRLDINLIGLHGPYSSDERSLGCDFARANLSLFRRNDQLPSGVTSMSGNPSSSNIELNDMEEQEYCRLRVVACIVVVGGNCAERDLTLGRRERGD